MDRRIVVDFPGIALQIEGNLLDPSSLGGSFSGAAPVSTIPRGSKTCYGFSLAVPNAGTSGQVHEMGNAKRSRSR